MFSRATKSVVKSLGQCSYSVGGENFKAITATGEFGQSLSQFLKKSSKFESVTVNEGITKSTQNGFNFQEGKKLHSYKDTMPELTRFRLNSESKSSDVTGNLSQIQKIPSLEAKKEGEDIIDILRKFPLAEESETANHLQMMPHTLQSKTTREKMFASHQIDPTGNQVSASKKLIQVAGSDPGDRHIHDDYFPQGDDYEADTGREDDPSYQGTPARHEEDDLEKMVPVSLQSGDQLQNLSVQNLSRIQEPNPTSLNNLLKSKEVEKETFEKLKALVDKVMEYKKRVFEIKGSEAKVEGMLDLKDQKRRENEKPSSGQQRLVPIN